MTPSDRDKGKRGAPDRPSASAPKDAVGARQPRWTEPRAKSPIAVALDYKRPDGTVDDKKAPRVAATGRGAVAEQILEIAFAKGIPVREDPDLAQLLVTLDVDSVIPVDALSAVAEILSYLYRLNGRAMNGEIVSDEAEAGPGARV
jgi:flagellar biosynthesis protein